MDIAPANQGDLRRGLVDVVAAAESNAAAMIADRFFSFLSFVFWRADFLVRR
jgi:hypothetical protein